MNIELPRMQPCEEPGPEIRSSLWMSHVPRGRTSSRCSAALGWRTKFSTLIADVATALWHRRQASNSTRNGDGQRSPYRARLARGGSCRPWHKTPIVVFQHTLAYAAAKLYDYWISELPRGL
jgi:hypothetical protein